MTYSDMRKAEAQHHEALPTCSVFWPRLRWSPTKY